MADRSNTPRIRDWAVALASSIVLAALTASASLADSAPPAVCGPVAESLSIAVELQASSLQCGLPRAAAGESQVAQSQLCCCEGFDGKQCCAQATDCSVSPPGCFCRPKQ